MIAAISITAIAPSSSPSSHRHHHHRQHRDVGSPSSVHNHRRLLRFRDICKVGICELPFHPISSEFVGGFGGTCVIRGCVPKKILVYGATFGPEIQGDYEKAGLYYMASVKEVNTPQ